MNPWPGLILCVVIALVVAFWFRRRAGDEEERKLRSAAGSDEVAARLLRHEMVRDPKLTREKAARRARERLEADRGR